MGFLDKVKSNNTNTAVAEAPKKVNPLLKKKAGEAVTSGVTTSEAPKKKILPIVKRKEDEVAEEPVAVINEPATEEVAAAEPEVEAVATEEPVEEAAAPEETANEPVVIKAPSKKGAKPVQNKEVPVAEPETPTEEEPVKEEPKAAVKPAPKATQKKGKTVSAKAVEPAATVVDEQVEVTRTSMSYADAVSSINSMFVDPVWEEYKSEISEELANIVVDPDANAGTLKVYIAELSILREKIALPLQDAKSQMDMLASKEPEGLIERTKRINVGSGNNDMERRKAGVLACMNYTGPDGSGPINLFEILDETRMRFNFLKSVMDSIEYKTRALITLNGALKLEQSHY